MSGGSSTDDDDEEEEEEDDTVMLECDYDTCPTKLYQSVEDKKWEEIAFFLDTGSWNNTLWLACGGIWGGNEPDPPRVEARTWVTALDSNGRVRWCQLPLHAAITFQAPLSIVQKLLEVYPKSARCADDQGLLPLHYAFRFGAPDDVVGCILQAFPQAIRKRAAKNRLPLDLAPFSSKPERGYIIDRFVDSAVKEAKVLWDAEHETKMLQQQEYQEHQQRRGLLPSKADFVNEELERRLLRKNQKLSRAMKDLKQTQKQLNALQRKLKEAAKEVTTTTSKATATTAGAPSRATHDEPEVNSILGPYHHGEVEDETGENRDDDEEEDGYEGVEDDPTAIQAPQQMQQQQQQERSMSRKPININTTPPSQYYSSPPSTPRSGRSTTDDRSRRSTRTSATDDRSRRSMRSTTVEDGSSHQRRSRSRSMTRKSSMSSQNHKPPAAKRVIRSIFQGLRGGRV